jgi:hypothetical protein
MTSKCKTISWHDKQLTIRSRPMFHRRSVLENIQKLRPPKMYQYIFPSYRNDSHKFQQKSGVDGHAKPRAKQRTQPSSQPRGQPRTTSPTCVSRVTWGPSQVVLIPDWSEGSHKGSHKGSHQDPTKGCPRDPTKNRQRIGDDPRQLRK